MAGLKNMTMEGLKNMTVEGLKDMTVEGLKNTTVAGLTVKFTSLKRRHGVRLAVTSLKASMKKRMVASVARGKRLP